MSVWRSTLHWNNYVIIFPSELQSDSWRDVGEGQGEVQLSLQYIRYNYRQTSILLTAQNLTDLIQHPWITVRFRSWRTEILGEFTAETSIRRRMDWTVSTGERSMPARFGTRQSGWLGTTTTAGTRAGRSLQSSVTSMWARGHFVLSRPAVNISFHFRLLLYWQGRISTKISIKQ